MGQAEVMNEFQSCRATEEINRNNCCLRSSTDCGEETVIARTTMTGSAMNVLPRLGCCALPLTDDQQRSAKQRPRASDFNWLTTLTSPEQTVRCEKAANWCLTSGVNTSGIDLTCSYQNHVGSTVPA